MSHSWTRSLPAALLAVAALLGACKGDSGDPSSSSVTLYGVTANNVLVSFPSNDPGDVTGHAITGLLTGEHGVDLDVRPANGDLYLLTDSSRVYTLATTGEATLVGGFTPLLKGTTYGFDFNPVTDRIRVVTDSLQNFRIFPATGSLEASDAVLAWATGDAHEGETPDLVAVAHNRNVAGTSSTTAYYIDGALSVLARSTTPNDGLLHTVGSLGISVSGDGGFEVARDGTAYAALVLQGETNPRLYRVNLSSGLVREIGAIAAGRLRGLSAAP